MHKVMIQHSAQKTKPFELSGLRMEARELAAGTYAVMATDVAEVDHAATNAGFVVGDTSVLVVESLSNGHLASQLIGAIRSVTSLPIRFLVNTSFHGDHCFGNFVFPGETVIIEHEATKKFLDDHFEEDRAFMIGLLGKDVGIEEAVKRSADLTCTDNVSIDLGGRQVEIKHIGYAQTDGDLIVLVPEHNVVFVGNMLQAPPPAFPWLFDGRPAEAAATYERLYDMLDDDSIIVPGHGVLMSRSDIRYSIAYLQELMQEVDDAAAKGLTVEQACEAIAMDKYSGYSMYDRIHFGVNIPALHGSA
jgi:cyclase